jgi:hypothetical protein
MPGRHDSGFFPGDRMPNQQMDFIVKTLKDAAKEAVTEEGRESRARIATLQSDLERANETIRRNRTDARSASERIDERIEQLEEFRDGIPTVGVTASSPATDIVASAHDQDELKDEPMTAVSAPPSPVASAFSDLGSAIAQGAIQGSIVGLSNEMTDVALGMLQQQGLSKELCENEAFKAVVGLALPAILKLLAQFEVVPQREFIDKAATLALTAQASKHTAEVVGFGAALGAQFLALPSARALQSQLMSDGDDFTRAKATLDEEPAAAAQ